MKFDRNEIQQMFIRVCRDSGWRLDAISSAIISGNVLGISPLEIWMAFSGLNIMNEIASGIHPVCQKEIK